MGGKTRVVLPIKAFIGWILKYRSFLHQLICLLQSNFSGKEKEELISVYHSQHLVALYM